MTEDEIILTHVLQCKPIDFLLHKPAPSKAQEKQIDEYRCRRRAGEPLQYILGTCNFMGLELAVDPSVLIPRPETEQLVDAALKFLKNRTGALRMLDLGTGSGNIAIALAKFIPQASIVAVDISAPALEIAQGNAGRHGVRDRIQFICDDFACSLKEQQKPWASGCNLHAFDMVISNPPYIPTADLARLPKDVQKEPKIALDGGKDGLNFFRIIIKYTPRLLRSGACLMMEFGDGETQAIKDLLGEEKIFSAVEIIPDLAGRDRIVQAII